MLNSLKEALKPIPRFIGQIIVPVFTTAVLWSYLDNVIKFLGAFLLTILVLKNLGFDINIARRISRTKLWRTLLFIVRSTNTVAKLNPEYFEETSQLLSENIKKGGTRMKDLGNKREEGLLWLKHNQKQILAYASLILLALDHFFGITARFGVTQDVIYALAAVLFIVALWVVGGEGFTSNTVNRVKEKTKTARSETKKTASLYKKELKRINEELERLKKYEVGELLPPDKKKEYDNLIASKEFYEGKVQEFLSKITEKKEELK